MTALAPPPADRILRAIVSTVVAMACFAILNAMSKTLSTSGYPVIEVIWARYVFAFVFMLVMFLPRNGRDLFAIRRLGTQVVRGLLLFFSSFFYFHGVVYLPLATAAAISLSSPLIVTALSTRLLGEPVGPRRWAAVAVGFIGALIIVRPGHTDPTTVADELESNPFVRIWRGVDGEGSERCTALGDPATLVLWGPDYDGGHKAWVRWPDGSDDIVPGSQVQRGAQ